MPQFHHPSGGISLRHLSRTVKSLRFSPACKPAGQPATASWMLAEDVSPLDQRQRSLLLSTAGSRSFMRPLVSFNTQSCGGAVEKSQWVLCTQRVCVIAEGPQAQKTWHESPAPSYWLCALESKPFHLSLFYHTYTSYITLKIVKETFFNSTYLPLSSLVL